MFTFYNIIAKLTLISFFIQMFRKYKIFRKLWTLLNSIVMTIFGISLLDNFGLEFLSNFIKEIKIITWNVVDYFTHTHIYNYFTELFSIKEDIPSSEKTNKNTTIISESKRETIGNEERIRKSEGNSKISEWLKPSIEEEIQTQETNYKKYFIIAGVVIASSLIWIYQEEIYIGAISLYDWINSFRSGPPSDPRGDNGGNLSTSSNTPIATNIPRQLDSQPPSPAIELIDKGKKKIFASPSIENLTNKVEEAWGDAPTSPTSSSSTETITPKNFNKLFEIKPEESVFSSIVRSNWKEMINSDNIKESINYVESHLPKSELDNTNYLNQLLDDVNKHNTNYAQEIVANKSEYSIEQLTLANNITEETWKWIGNMRKEIKKFE